MDQNQNQTATLPRLDETSLRRTDFRPGPTVTLADGQAWTVASPTIVIVPVVAPGQEMEIEYGSEFGPDFDRKLLALQSVESFEDEARALFGIAVDLLGRNYDLAPADYPRLLRYEVGNVEANRPLDRIYNIAIGRRVGPEAESSPAAIEADSTTV